MRDILTVFLKDVSIEIRGGGIVPSVAVFAVVLASVLRLSGVLPPGPASSLAAPAMFWICLLFAATVAFERSFEIERKSEAIRVILMSPAGRGDVFIGKTLANLALLLAVEVFFIPAFSFFFGLGYAVLSARFLLATFAATVGIAAVGTLLSALCSRTRGGGVLLPVLMFPLLIPVLTSATLAVSAALGSGIARDFSGHIKVLVSFDLAFVAAGTLVYGYIIEEI